MAEAYRGLTIRLGADASDLVKSLRYTSSAISDTQRQLRSLQKAAKIDPDGMRALGLQADVTADKALGLTKKVRTLNEVIKKAEASDDFRKIGGDLDYASTKAADAKARYAQLCEEIKRLKNEYAKLAGYNDLDNDDPFKGVEGVRDTIAVMERLASESEEAAKRFDELSAKYKELANLHGIAQKEKELAEFAVEVRNAKVDMAAASAEASQFYRELAKLSLNPKVASTSEFIELSGRIKRCTQAVDELKAETRELDKALDIDPSNMDAARLKMAAMTEQVNLNIQKMKDLRLQIAKLEDAGADKVASDFVDLRTEIVRTEDQAAKLAAEFLNAKAALDKLEKSSDGKTEAELRQAREEASRLEAELAQCKERLDQLGSAQLYSKLKADLNGVSSSTYRLVQDMTQAEGRTRAFSGAMQQLGWSAYSTLTPAITIFAHQAIASAEEVDASYRNMRKTVQGTEEQFEALKQAAIDYSRTHFTSADQLLEIEALGGQLGVAVEDLEEFATVVSNLEIATDLDAETAATQLGQLRGITKMTADEFDSYGDALVRLGNNNAIMESKISDVMLRISSMGTIVGMTVPELLAWSTAVASTGQGAESAGTAISNTMSDIETAVSSGGDKLQAFAEIAQMSAEEFARAWDEDPSSAMKAFIEGLNAIEDAGGSADAALGELGINGVRQKQAILGLMQTIEGLNDNLEMSNDAWNGVSDKWGAAGDAAREAERKAEGFSGSIQLLRNNAQAFATELGESLAPAIDTVADGIAALTQWYSDLPEAGKQAINVMLLFGAALGPVTVGANAFVNAYTQIKDVLAGRGSAWRTTQRDISLVATTLEKLGLVAPGAAGETRKLAQDVKKSGTAAKVASAGFGILKGALGVIGTGVLIAGLDQLVAYLEESAEKAALFENATEGLRESVDAVDGSIRDAADSINGMSTDVATKSFTELREEIDETIAKGSELADSIEDAFGEVNGNSYALSNYIGTIEELTNKYDENGNKATLNSAEQAKLKAALDAVNGIMDTTYEVTDGLNGVISVSTEELKRNAEAWEDNARSQAAYEKMVDLQKQQLDLETQRYSAITNLEEAERALREAEAVYAEDPSAGNAALVTDMTNRYNAAADALSDVDDQLNAVTDATDRLQSVVESSELEKMAQGMADALKGIAEGSGGSFDAAASEIESLSEVLVGLSVSQDELTSKAPGDLQRLVDAYSQGSDELVAALGEMGIGFDDAAAQSLVASDAIRESIEGMGEGVAETVEAMGTNTADLASKLHGIGVTAEQMSQISSEQFQAMLMNCGGSLETLGFMIQNYNGTPLFDKNGNVNMNSVQLIDAQNRVWTWNNGQLKTQEGYVYVDSSQLATANGEMIKWNENGLPTINGVAMAQYQTVQLANGEMATWDGTYLKDQNGHVYADYLELTDCLGTMVRYDDYQLQHKDANVYSDYSELVSAMGQIDSFKRLDGTTVHTYTVHHDQYVSGTQNAAGGFRFNAQGGILTRYHAAGAIATKAVPLDIVGEAGAEAIVPLTNKRYVTPFARTVADEFGASRDFEKLYAETLYARSVAESMAREMRRAMTGVQAQAQPGTHIDEVNINQRVVTQQDDIYVAAPAMARSAAREIRKLGR